MPPSPGHTFLFYFPYHLVFMLLYEPPISREHSCAKFGMTISSFLYATRSRIGGSQGVSFFEASRLFYKPFYISRAMQAEGSYFLSLTPCQCMRLEFEASLDYIVRLSPNKQQQKPQRLYLSLGSCCPVGQETVSHSGLDLCFAGG